MIQLNPKFMRVWNKDISTKYLVRVIGLLDGKYVSVSEYSETGDLPMFLCWDFAKDPARYRVFENAKDFVFIGKAVRHKGSKSYALITQQSEEDEDCIFFQGNWHTLKDCYNNFQLYDEEKKEWTVFGEEI